MMQEQMLSLVKEIKIFDKNIKMYGSIEYPWFVASDVANWINHSNPTVMLKSVDEDEKGLNIVYTLGGNQTKWCLTEDGLYEVCMQSRKPIAKQIKKEIKKYLKEIRLTGGTVADNREEEFINTYFPSFTDETKFLMIQDLLHQKEEYRKKNEEYEKQLEEQRPMIENYKILMDTTGTFSMNEVAHFAKIGEYKLFEFLRGIGILFKNSSGDNIPYENPVNKNKFIVCHAITPDGKSHSVTRVLPSGIDYILKKLKEYEYVEAV